uniref:Protein inhibitor of activated STAT, 1b n=1 Tax=Denticeps clupeoides TaxID=299321 RepID=A0AAY4CN20_9TELE
MLVWAESGSSQMVMSLRVSELQVLLGYAGRNKHGRKHELLTKALHLLKAGCSPAVQMKIKELYRRRFPTKMLSPADLTLAGVHSGSAPGAAALPLGLTQLGFDGHHGATSPLLPVSLLGPKHELALPHLPPALHPVHPDVKLQRLPFYDLLDELIRPTSLASDSNQRFQETCFAFALTPQQVQQISGSMDISGTKCDFTVQVQLRFCLSETSCPQEDHFPSNLCVKVNGKPCSLPAYLPQTKNGVEGKRPSRPINITSLVRLSPTVPNTIIVSWLSEIGRSYSMAVYLVRQQSSSVLLQRLRAKGIRNPDHSRALIKEKLTADPDSEIATTSLRVSLLCPLGKMRLMVPCRALTCSHLQCFDATLYIQMNEKKPTWVCPVCDKKAPYEHLIIDGLFMEILNSCTDCDEIQFKEDGNWAPMRSRKIVQEVSASSNGVEGMVTTHTQQYNVCICSMSVLMCLCVSGSYDHELLLNRFLPYGSSQLFLDQSSASVGGSVLATANGGGGGSSSGSSSSLVSSGSLRDGHAHVSGSRPSSDAAAASVIYGSIPDVISLD